jgi:signal transduction histidine kinase
MTTRQGEPFTLRHEPLPELWAPERTFDHRGVGHDLRQSLATIRSIAQLLLADAEDSARWPSRVAAIVDEASYAIELSETLLRRTTTSTTADLADAAQCATRSAALRCDGVPTQVLFLATAPAAIDPLSAWRVATNLVDNAHRAAGPRGTVVVATFVSGCGAVLRVEDDAAAASYASGSGVGLQVVRAVLDACEGQLRIDESDLGGTRATVCIPGPILASIDPHEAMA